MLYAPNGARLYSTSLSGCLAVYDANLSTHTLVKVIRGVVSGKPVVKPLAMESDGSRIAAIAANNSTVSILETADLQEVCQAYTHTQAELYLAGDSTHSCTRVQ